MCWTIPIQAGEEHCIPLQDTINLDLMLLIVRGYEHSIFFILNLSCLVKECSALLQPVSEWSGTLEDSLDVAVAATNLTTGVISSLN